MNRRSFFKRGAAAGLPAAIVARDHGATVIVIDANHDIGARESAGGFALHGLPRVIVFGRGSGACQAVTF